MQAQRADGKRQTSKRVQNMTRSWQLCGVATVLLVLFGTPMVWAADPPASDPLPCLMAVPRNW